MDGRHLSLLWSSRSFCPGRHEFVRAAAAYGADITYATAKEAGFDFLRDGLVLDPAEIVHRRLDVAIVDEADSILIDEARIPLVIAGSVETEQLTPERLAQLVARLDAGHHYEADREHSTAHLTDDGLDLAENLLGEIVLHDEANLPLLNDLHAALYAAVILEKDVDYIVRDGRVEVVDEFTGRVAEDRHWPDRLQAAIEAKEGVRSSAEGRILGQITLHHFLSQYQHRCGMTATAAVSAREFIQVYGLEVKVVPPNRPCLRVDQADAVFADAETWNAALIEEIRSVHARSRPLLVGTPSVAESESLAARLRQAGIACAVLNAKCDAEEADLIAEAGRPGAVTVSTNMAGRGTDICLGGSDASTRDAVVALGGLYVICTHHHESRRVDDQLRGRAGRQGDPGSSRFFVSLEDELMDTYGIGELIPQRHWPAPTFAPITDPFVLREVARVQRIAEGSSYDLRHALLQYSQIVEEQRRIAFEHRRQVLAGARPPDGSRDSPSWQPRFQRLVHRLGAETTADLTHRLYLLAIDDVWSDHLALVAEIREGIHLVGVGGMSPLEEFAKEVIAAFAHFHERVDELFSERLSALAENHDLTIDDRSLRGPSSTWTYLIDDSLFENRVASAIIGNRDIGFSAGAALTGPLLALWALARKRRRRR